MNPTELIGLASLLIVTCGSVVGVLLYVIHAEQAKAKIRDEELRAELKPNHGSSFRDEMAAGMSDIRGDVAALGEAQRDANKRHALNEDRIITLGKELLRLNGLLTDHLVNRKGTQ